MRKLISLVVIGLLLIINFNLLKSSYESANKLEQLSKEEEKVKELEQTNKSLKEELEKRNSPFFVEQEARNRLGYSKPGESIVVVEDSVINETRKQESANQSNLQKWLELLRI